MNLFRDLCWLKSNTISTGDHYDAFFLHTPVLLFKPWPTQSMIDAEHNLWVRHLAIVQQYNDWSTPQTDY
jgi:hypothetical protein